MAVNSDALMPTMVNGTNDLLVSYPWRQFHPARHEIRRILRQFGDPHPQIEKTNVPGIAIVRTTLNNRHIIKQCRELFEREPIFRFAVKWVPVDFWCETDLQAMKSVIETQIRDLIEQDNTWAMELEKRRWREYHTKEIIDYLAASIDRKVNLRNPDRIVLIDVLGPKTAISLLKPDEIFSIGVPTLT
jgi:tRNA acetyltransferase TAN1